jgi:hypothetical protein
LEQGNAQRRFSDNGEAVAYFVCDSAKLAGIDANLPQWPVEAALPASTLTFAI